MYKVKNQKVIRRLSTKTLLANKKKNLVAVMAIMLTCILFTAVFSIGGSMLKSSEESTMRQVGGSQMAGLKYARWEDYDILSKDSAVRDINAAIIVGRAANDELSDLNTEVNYADDLYAKGSFCEPETGRMPEKRDEIAASSLVLKQLGVPCELGARVPLQIDVEGKVTEENLTLVGFWEGDPVSMAQECWISRELAEELAPQPDVAYQDNPGAGFAGYLNINFNFATSWDIEGQVLALLERNGYDPDVTAYGVNWAYSTSSVDGETIAMIAGILLIILISGYLIIYNVFYINVTGEIHEYGLLKTIGTTARQLKKLVRRQAMLLSLVGIPAGLVIGTLLSKVLLPVVMGQFTVRIQVFSMHPLIYAAAAVFTFATVFLSCNKPCRLAAKVSPMEALRYTEKTSVKKKTKKSRKFSALHMAAENMKRSRKKILVVVLSLSMSLILVNMVYCIVHSFDTEKYVSNSIVGDFRINHESLENPGSPVTIWDGVSPEEFEMFAKTDGVENAYRVYASYGTTILDETGVQRVSDFMDRHEELQKDSLQKDLSEAAVTEKALDTDLYGVDEEAFKKLTFYTEPVTWEEFNSGDYVIMAEQSAGSEHWIFQTGDKIKLQMYNIVTGAEEEKEYTVIAAADLPHPMSTRSIPAFGTEPILPEGEYLALTGRNGALNVTLEVTKEQQEAVEEMLQAYTESGNSELTYASRQTYLDEFEDLVSMFWIVGGALAFILALIGVLNFINAVVTGILTRKQEFAMMEAVGMTRKQLRGVLITEGIGYAVLTILFSVTVGSGICALLVKAAAGSIWFFSFHFSLLPILLCIPVLLIVSVLVPFFAYQLNGASIVERLKVME